MTRKVNGLPVFPLRIDPTDWHTFKETEVFLGWPNLLFNNTFSPQVNAMSSSIFRGCLKAFWETQEVKKPHHIKIKDGNTK